MIEEKKIEELVISKIEGLDLFLVNITVSAANEIRVSLDSLEGVQVQECAQISRSMVEDLDLIDDNYSLEVSSPGLSEPFLVQQQYEKNIGQEVEIVFTDGRKKKGKLLKVDEAGVIVEVGEKMFAEGGSQKKKKTVLLEKAFAFEEIKSTKVVITF